MEVAFKFERSEGDEETSARREESGVERRYSYCEFSFGSRYNVAGIVSGLCKLV